MIQNNPERMVEYLNKILALDPAWVDALVKHRPPCNDAIRDHPTIQALESNAAGMLGLLNGYFGIFEDGPMKGFGPISMIVEADGRIARFAITKPGETIND